MDLVLENEKVVRAIARQVKEVSVFYSNRWDTEEAENELKIHHSKLIHIEVSSKKSMTQFSLLWKGEIKKHEFDRLKKRDDETKAKVFLSGHKNQKEAKAHLISKILAVNPDQLEEHKIKRILRFSC